MATVTEEERVALYALSHCVNFGMARFARRFAKDLDAKPDDFELSPRQKWNLGRLCWSYRRQLPARVVSWTLEFYAGLPAPAIEQFTKAQKAAVLNSTKLQKALETLSGAMLRFGDDVQISALRIIRRTRA